MSDDKPIDRRRFFRTGLAEILKPLARAVRPLEAMAHEIGKLEDPLPQRSLPQIRRAQNTVSKNNQFDPAGDEHWIRPPGALPEQQFRETCSRCGDCVRTCPVGAIQIDSSGVSGAGAPYIDVESQACVLCENLECMQHCPTGALVQLSLDQIDIGTAVWHEYQCLRPSGGSCSICVDHCPVGAAAIDIVDDRVVVHETGCTGCGVCQHDCPTWPKSITVTPRSEREARASENNRD